MQVRLRSGQSRSDPCRARSRARVRSYLAYATQADRYDRPTPFCRYGRCRGARQSSLGRRFGFDQFRCTRPGQLVVGGGSSGPCRPAALLQVLTLLPVGSDFSQGRQIFLRIAVCMNFSTQIGVRTVTTAAPAWSAASWGCENPMTIDATAPITIPCIRRVRDLPRRIDGTCMAFIPSIRVSRTQRVPQRRPVPRYFAERNRHHCCR